MPPSAIKDEDVSVVIVSWNVADLLRDCLGSLLSQVGGLSLRIIVVDNASSDGSPAMVRAEFPHVHLVPSDLNLGFARGNNLGLAQAQGRYVFFLNPDTVVSPNALQTMVMVLERRDDVGIVGPRLVSLDGAVQYTCARTIPSLSLILLEGLYLHRLPVMGKRLFKALVSPYDLDVSQEVEAISGAAMLVRRNLVQALAGFDESYLHTAEDIDLCMRIRQRGSRIYFCAEAEVVHVGGQSSLQALPQATTMSFLSMHTYFERAHGRGQALIYRLIVQLIQIPMLLIVGATKAVLGREGSPNLRERFRLAKTVWRWRISR